MDGLKAISPPVSACDGRMAQAVPLESMVEEARSKRARSPDELVELFSDDVWRFVSAQVIRREDAEDIVMEVFAAAFSSFHKLEKVHDHRFWLLCVARRKV